MNGYFGEHQIVVRATKPNRTHWSPSFSGTIQKCENWCKRMKIWDNLIDDVGKLIPAGVECEIKMINSTEFYKVC